MSLSDEVCSYSRRDCLDLNEADDATSSRFSVLMDLPSLFKKDQITSEEADSIMTSIAQLLEELLSADKNLANLTDYQDIAIEVLEALLPLCSLDVLDHCRFLLSHLLYRLRSSENNMDSLDRISSCILILSLDAHNTSPTFLHQVTDVLTKFCVEHSEVFPFRPVIERLSQYMKVLQEHNDEYEFVSSHHEWPQNMRTIMDRFLRTKTELLSDDTRILFFSLVKEVIETIGTEWFAPNVSMLLLLVLQVEIQIRICLDKAEIVNAHVLATCFHILEMAVHCVEESSFLEDSTAAQIATSVREAALYSIEYWVTAKEEEEKLTEEVELILYRFISCILTIGGAEMLPETLIQKCSPHILQVFQQGVADGDYSIARLALPYLNLFTELPDNTVVLVVDVVISQFPAGEWKDAMNDVVDCIDSLKSRTDFYSSKTLMEAQSKIKATMANSFLYSTLCGLIASL